MALNAYLKLDGVEGESTDSQHKGEIELLSFSWGVSQGGVDWQGAGRALSKVEIHAFNFVHKVDKASPVLFKKSCSGEAILIGMLQVQQPGLVAAEQVSFNDATAIGRSGLVFMKVHLEDILVSSVKEGGNAQDDAPLEEVSLNYAKIKFEYIPLAGDSVVGSCPSDSKPKKRGVPAVQ